MSGHPRRLRVGDPFGEQDQDSLRNLLQDWEGDVGLSSNFGALVARIARGADTSKKRKKRCGQCDGAGASAEGTACESCGGAGNLGNLQAGIRECDKCDAIGWIDNRTGKGARSPATLEHMEKCVRCQGKGETSIPWTELILVHGGSDGGKPGPQVAELWGVASVHEARDRADSVRSAYRTLAALREDGLGLHAGVLARLYGHEPPGLGDERDPRSLRAILSPQTKCKPCAGNACRRCRGVKLVYSTDSAMRLIDVLPTALRLGEQETEDGFDARWEKWAKNERDEAARAGRPPLYGDTPEEVKRYAQNYFRARNRPTIVGPHTAVSRRLARLTPARGQGEAIAAFSTRSSRALTARNALIATLRSEARRMQREAEEAYAAHRVLDRYRRTQNDARRVIAPALLEVDP